MTTSNVVVTVVGQPASGVILKVEGVVLRDFTVSSRDDWDGLVSRLDPDTRKVLAALRPFCGIHKVVIHSNVINIRSDCDYARIKSAVKNALQAELVEYVPPPKRRVFWFTGV